MARRRRHSQHLAHQGHDHGHDHHHDHAHGDDAHDDHTADHGGVPDDAGAMAGELEDLDRSVGRRIALSQIRQYGDPALRMRAGEVGVFDEGLRSLAERMTALMHQAGGIGLAATQLGILRRLFVCTLDDEDIAIVNPVLAASGKATESDTEGCLSLAEVKVAVERPVSVTLEGLDLDGEPLRFELEGLSARVVQHELDHLDGTLIIDRADPESRREALRLLRPRLALQG